MRLFQEHIRVENFDPPPSIYRDKIEIKQIPLLKQFRQSTKRLPTPDKDAIIRLSNSFEKRRLGKQQRLLADIAQRCREQEIGDLSEKLSSKCNIFTLQENKEVLGYSTTFTKQQGGQSNISPERGDNSPTTESSGDSSKTTFERSYKHFPMRRIIKHQNKFDLSKTTLPKIKPSFTKMSDHHKPKLSKSPRINGAVSHDNRTSPRPDSLAHLTLPNLPLSLDAEDKFDAFNTSRLNIGQRSSSHVLLAGNTFGGRTYQTSELVKRHNTFNDNISPIHQLLGEMNNTYPPTTNTTEPEKGPRPTPAALTT